MCWNRSAVRFVRLAANIAIMEACRILNAITPTINRSFHTWSTASLFRTRARIDIAGQMVGRSCRGKNIFRKNTPTMAMSTVKAISVTIQSWTAFSRVSTTLAHAWTLKKRMKESPNTNATATVRKLKRRLQTEMWLQTINEKERL